MNKKTLTAMVTYNRPEYVDQTFQSFERSGFFEQADMNHFVVFDGGSDQSSIDVLEKWKNKYKFTVNYSNERKTYFQQFERIRDYCKENGYEAFLFIESDIVVSKNFYKFIISTIGRLGDWSVLSFYTCDERPSCETYQPFIYSKGVGDQYGTCMMVFKLHAIDKIIDYTLQQRKPLDICICPLFGYTKEEEKLGRHNIITGPRFYFSKPSVCQHVGEISSIGAPMHKAFDFRGEEFDLLKLLD